MAQIIYLWCFRLYIPPRYFLLLRPPLLAKIPIFRSSMQWHILLLCLYLKYSLCVLFLFLNWCYTNSRAHLFFSWLARTAQRPPWNTSGNLCGLNHWKLKLPPSQSGNQQIPQPPLYLITSSANSQPRQSWFWPSLAPITYQFEHVVIA